MMIGCHKKKDSFYLWFNNKDTGSVARKQPRETDAITLACDGLKDFLTDVSLDNVKNRKSSSVGERFTVVKFS